MDPHREEGSDLTDLVDGKAAGSGFGYSMSFVQY